MKRIFTFLTASFILTAASAQTYHPLATSAFSQDWSNIGLITANDDWSGVPSIRGFIGNDDAGSVTGVDPRSLLSAALSTNLDVVANGTTPSTQTSGGVYEFEITNPVVAFQGSGTADAPNLVVYLNTTGRSNILFSFLARDIDDAIDNSIQQVAVQYRVGTTGDFINIPTAYIPDASSGPSLAIQSTPLSFTLPTAAEDQAQVEVRIITSNAIGSDEFIGIDDILVTQGTAMPLDLKSFNAAFNGKTGRLNWITLNELNVKGFSLEKSMNGKDFSEIGFVEAKNNSIQNNYSLEDINVKGGTNYYRLKMIDRDGAFKYSHIVVLNDKNAVSAEVYPNPAINNVIVTHPKAESKATISILSGDGRVVKKYTVQQGSIQTAVIVSELVKGNYLLMFESNGGKSITKFVKQ